MPLICVTEKKTVEAKFLKIHCKVADRFTAQLLDPNHGVIHDQEDGYVPSFMPGNHYGDYVILDIDLDTGVILNWIKPCAQNLEEWVSGE